MAKYSEDPLISYGFFIPGLLGQTNRLPRIHFITDIVTLAVHHQNPGNFRIQGCKALKKLLGLVHPGICHLIFGKERFDQRIEIDQISQVLQIIHRAIQCPVYFADQLQCISRHLPFNDAVNSPIHQRSETDGRQYTEQQKQNTKLITKRHILKLGYAPIPLSHEPATPFMLLFGIVVLHVILSHDRYTRIYLNWQRGHIQSLRWSRYG
ncbi:hypothetical protein D3C81_1191680 [compost metagenome]